MKPSKKKALNVPERELGLSELALSPESRANRKYRENWDKIFGDDRPQVDALGMKVLKERGWWRPEWDGLEK